MIKISIVICILAAFILGIIGSTAVFVSILLKGDIIIDRTHYKHPATLFKMDLNPDEIFRTKYITFRVMEGDLREKFGPDIQLKPEDFEDGCES